MQITREDDFGGTVLNCAVRYALGRASYMPSLVMDQIKPMLPDCPDKTLWCFERDVSEWIEDETWMMGDMFIDWYYKEEWSNFLNAVRAEIEKRKKV